MRSFIQAQSAATALFPGASRYLFDSVGAKWLRSRAIAMRALRALCVAAVCTSGAAHAQIITAVTGSGSGIAPDGSVAANVSVASAREIVVDTAGNVFFVESLANRIRRIDAVTGRLSTVVGTGTPGFTPDGPAATTQIGSVISGLAVGADGSVFYADANNNRVRRVRGGTVTTVAGSGVQQVVGQPSGDGGLATAAPLTLPGGLALDADSNLYIADSGAYRIRRVRAVDGVIETIAGAGFGYRGDGGPATAALFQQISGIAIDANGRVLVNDSGNRRIRRFTVGGIITTIAGNGTGNFGGDGGPAIQAGLVEVLSLAVDGTGAIFLADNGARRVRRIALNGVITTVAGDGLNQFPTNGVAATATSVVPAGLAVDRSGGLLVTDPAASAIRRVAPLTTPFTFGFFLAPGGALPVAAVPVQATGPINATTVRVTLDFGQLPLADLARASPRASRFEVYVVALVPGQLLALPLPYQVLLQDDRQRWGVLGNPVQAFARNVDPSTLAQNRLVVTLLENFDTSLLPGTEFYLGYGTDASEMLGAGRYRGVYKVLPP